MTDVLVHTVGFTGSREGMSLAQQDALRLVLRDHLEPSLLVHGDCIGADAEAHGIARSQGIGVRIRPSTLSSAFQASCKADDGEAWPPKPPLDRNKDIVHDGDVLIGAPRSQREELRSGTWSTIRYARKMCVRVILVFPDGSVEDSLGLIT